MALTLKHLLRKPITVQYPEQRLATSRRIRGQEFIWMVDRCTGCSTCAKSCPHGIIEIVTSKAEDNMYYVERIEFALDRCMYCGLCVEACPFTALYMGRSYEKAKYRLGEIACDREELMALGKEISAYGHPELEEGIPEQTLLVYRKQYGV